MKVQSIKTIKNLSGKRVLLRVDFNVPIDKRGVTDDERIRQSLPTIKYLLAKKAKVIVMTHLGRPEGRVVDSLKLNAVAIRLSKLLGKKVHKLHNCVGKNVSQTVSRLKPGEIVLLENVRFHKEEESCEKSFTKALASLGDIFVNDAFAASHRRHASVYGIATILPSYAGFLLEKEIKNLTPLLGKLKRPVVMVMGGAKIDTKIGIIKNFFHKADTFLIGGALANTFLAAEGFDVGKSYYEQNKINVARETLLMAEKFHEKIVIPEDAIVADEVTQYAKTLDVPVEDTEGNMKILDIGSKTCARFENILKKAKTVIWNGPMGLYEFAPFANGTKAMAIVISKLKRKGVRTFIGGGDTIDALKRFKIPFSRFTFISTGGGAMLEFLEGKKLPGIQVLMK